MSWEEETPFSDLEIKVPSMGPDDVIENRVPILLGKVMKKMSCFQTGAELESRPIWLRKVENTIAEAGS